MSADRLWYKDAIIYQVRTRSFYDSNGDGIGDLAGLTQKLDYLQDLGVTALWLLPFYPSPLRDDGYDISDYTGVHSECGTLRDFRTFLREAHRRGLRVVTELVLNHTSDQHPWFQRARRSQHGTRFRDFYVWSDTPDRYAEARIIFKDFETSNWAWDPVAKAYFWHRFYAHQPDLNFDNPEVRRAMLNVVDSWLDMGVDGLRLDAVPYLYEREGSSCENLPETHAFLRELRAHVDRRYPDRMLLAEANQWPEDAAAYFGKGDECHMAFHFPIMPRLFMAMHIEDRFPILDILEQTPPIPETCQWSLFLRNHDELTLEMVTDEERDYMWRVYASDPRARINLGIRRRLAPLLQNNRRKIELMKALLLSLPGTPVIYYGDEIGMGDNVYLGDRNGVRTPMQWSPDRNAGFSRSNPQQLFLPVIVDPEYHFEALNVEVQQGNPSSLLWWTKRIVALRKQFRAFGRGTFEPLIPANRKVIAFLRRYEGEVILVVANLSRFSQYAELDLRQFKGAVPVELLGHVRFPPIGELPYLLTLGPHAFYWFSLESPSEGGAQEVREREAELPFLEADRSWDRLLAGRERARLEAILPRYLVAQRWFRGKARQIKAASVVDAIPEEAADEEPRLALVRVDYVEGEPETYVLPLAFVPGREGAAGVLARVRVRSRDGEHEGLLVEALDEASCAGLLLDAIVRRRRLRGREFEARGLPARALQRLRSSEGVETSPRLLRGEQTNNSWAFGERLILKLLRRIEGAQSVELEILRHLTERVGFPHTPALAGHLEIRGARGFRSTLAIAQAWVPNEGDAWKFTLDEIDRYFERALLERPDVPVELPSGPVSVVERARHEPPAMAVDHIGGYLEMARLLARRTGELHLALAAAADDPQFAPEPFTAMPRRSLYQSLRLRASRSLELLAERLGGIPEGCRTLAEEILGAEPEIIDHFRDLVDRPVGGSRIRCHGDYHLGQVLYTGRDFVVIDFEGEPDRPIGERLLKRSPLFDVAGMIRSFEYAAEAALEGRVRGVALRPEDVPRLAPWARMWYAWVSSTFLASYLDTVRSSSLIPEDPRDLALLLDAHVLEKALYELGYELNNRPDWVAIPLRGIVEIIRSWHDGG